jgi:tRNA (Thr-GGU) A37 N-methylase
VNCYSNSPDNRLARKEARKLFVKMLDAINNTPVIDIKPVMKPFLVKNTEEIKEPAWVTPMHHEYWL